MHFRCPAGFDGERCETRNSALSDQANQDDEALQTGIVTVSQKFKQF